MDLPDYLKVTRSQLEKCQPVKVRIVGDMPDLARNMAATMLDTIKQIHTGGSSATLIVPVGPVDQYPVLANMINHEGVNCQQVTIINMDEYLTDNDELLEPGHPLSLLGYMQRKFYDLLDPQLAPRPENRVHPDPKNPTAIGRLIGQRGGVDACFGGIGINGHIAFNEPPEPGHELDVDTFASLPTRCLDLSRESRTINSNTVGGEISIIPRRCVTVGMKEILSARRLRIYCNRPWQSAVVRRMLYGPITPACPSSLIRKHADAHVTVTTYVADPPDIRLR